MAKRNLSNKLIPIEDIKEQMVLIEESECSYITPSGKVYTEYSPKMFYPMNTFENKVNHYIYVGFKSKTGKMIQRRVHRLVAIAYLPNPNNLPIVCHKDDDKTNPNLSNLFWGTNSENTQDAFNKGLAKNAKGFDDSQSEPVSCFDLDCNFIKHYGSISEAAKETGITKRGVIYQCEHLMKQRPRKGYYFRYYTEYLEKGFVL